MTDQPLYYQTSITKATLTSIGNPALSIDITGLILFFEFTESIFQHTLHGKLVMADGVGLMNSENFTITGEEFLEISFETAEEKSFTYKFVVSKVDIEVRNSSSDSSVLALTLMSVDGFSNLFTFISKGYGSSDTSARTEPPPTTQDPQTPASEVEGSGAEGRRPITITDIVKQILSEELRSEIEIDDTKFTETTQNYYYGFTRTRPFEKIQMLQQKAFQQTDYISSTFVFYEDRSGYNFKSIENIIDLSASNNTPLTYSYSQLGSYLGFVQPNFRLIRSYEPASRMHNYDRLQAGFYKTSLLLFDVWTKRIITNTFNAYEDYKNFAHMQGSQNDQAAYTLNVSTQFAEKVNQVSDYTLLMPYDSEQDDLTYKNILYSRPFVRLLSENSLNIVIDGTLQLELADPIIIQIPDNRPSNDNTRELDPRYSGRYFVASITHSIDNNDSSGTGYKCSLIVTRDLLPINQSIYDQQVSDNIDIPALQSGGTAGEG